MVDSARGPDGKTSLQPLPKGLQGPSDSELEYAAGDIRDSFLVLEIIISNILDSAENGLCYRTIYVGDAQLSALQHSMNNLGNYAHELYHRVCEEPYERDTRPTKRAAKRKGQPAESGGVVALETGEA